MSMIGNSRSISKAFYKHKFKTLPKLPLNLDFVRTILRDRTNIGIGKRMKLTALFVPWI